MNVGQAKGAAMVNLLKAEGIISIVVHEQAGVSRI